MNPLVRDLLDRADDAAARRLYRLASIRPDRERARLRAAGRPHLAPDLPPPTWEELAETSDWVIDQAHRRRAVTIRLTGLAGAPSLPSEVAIRGIGLLRLAQRLALVHGFDPGDDRGQAAIRQALAAGLGQRPFEGPLQARLTDLARSRPSVGGQLARAVVGTASADAVRGLERLIPLVGATRVDVGLVEAGERMASVYRRLAVLPGPRRLEDATEVSAAARTPDPPA